MKKSRNVYFRDVFGKSMPGPELFLASRFPSFSLSFSDGAGDLVGQGFDFGDVHAVRVEDPVDERFPTKGHPPVNCLFAGGRGKFGKGKQVEQLGQVRKG